MGASASKQVTRKLPKTARPETLRSIPRASPSTLQAQRIEHAQDIKNDSPDDIFGDMEQQRSDPQLLENLAKLGPVTVPPTITRMRQSDPMLGILRERQRVENDDQPNNHRITTDALFSILEHRKHLAPNALDQSEKKWQELSKECGGVDISDLKALFKYYNTITVMPPSNPEDKSERRQGIWVEDKVEWKSAVETTRKKHLIERQAKENSLRDTELKVDHQEPSKESKEERRERHLKDLFVD